MSTTAPATFTVPSMSCEHCVNAITGKVSPLDGVDSVAIDLDTKVVTVVGGDETSIRSAIEEAGYEVG